jgi:hypothetical protein
MADIADSYQIAFTHGRSIEKDGRLISFAVVPVGRVSLPSGRIVACDPLTASRPGPFVQEVLPGRYEVDLSLLREPGIGELVAMARVRFTVKQPSVWVMALRKGENLKTLAPGGFFGFRSESGTSAYMDANAVSLADFADLDDIDELLVSLTGNYRPHRYWLDMPLDRRLNVVMFSSGKEAGRYASYFGIDAEGDVCTLVTDFRLINW